MPSLANRLCRGWSDVRDQCQGYSTEAIALHEEHACNSTAQHATAHVCARAHVLCSTLSCSQRKHIPALADCDIGVPGATLASEATDTCTGTTTHCSTPQHIGSRSGHVCSHQVMVAARRVTHAPATGQVCKLSSCHQLQRLSNNRGAHYNGRQPLKAAYHTW
jgi:hypothetical protein